MRKIVCSEHTGGIVVLQELQRDRVQPVGGNDVAGEGQSRRRIVDDRGGEYLAEVAGKHLGSRHGISIQHALATAKGLVVRHEEQFVASIEQVRDAHRPVQFEAVVVPLERVLRFGGSELVLLSVENVVAQKFEERAMVRVAARLGEHIHLRALMTILRRVNAVLNFELLNRIDGGKAIYELKFTSMLLTPSSV